DAALFSQRGEWNVPRVKRFFRNGFKYSSVRESPRFCQCGIERVIQIICGNVISSRNKPVTSLIERHFATKPRYCTYGSPSCYDNRPWREQFRGAICKPLPRDSLLRAVDKPTIC